MRRDTLHDHGSDGALIALWPLAMGIGVWGTGLIYQGIAHGGHNLEVGVALVVGGGFLCSRWISQARRVYRRVRARRGAAAAAPPAR